MLLADGPVIAAARRDIAAVPGLEAVRCDVRDPGSVDEMFRALSGRTLAWVVNCAAVGYYAPLDDDHSAAWRDIVGTNVLGLVHVLSGVLRFQTACPLYVHVGSMASRRPSPTPGNGVYSATKVAAVSLLDHFRTELRARGSAMRVALVTPGYIHGTDFGANYFRDTPGHSFDLFESTPSLSPGEVAEAIAGILRSDSRIEVMETVLAPRAAARPAGQASSAAPLPKLGQSQ